MLLTLVWDKTASGTARSKTGNGLHSWSAPRFCMGRDCLWDSEEQHREWNGMYILCFAPRCPRGSLVPYKNKEQISCAVHSQSCSSLSQRQSRPIQKWGASVLRGSPYGENCVCGMYGVRERVYYRWGRSLTMYFAFVAAVTCCCSSTQTYCTYSWNSSIWGIIIALRYF